MHTTIIDLHGNPSIITIYGNAKIYYEKAKEKAQTNQQKILYQYVITIVSHLLDQGAVDQTTAQNVIHAQTSPLGQKVDKIAFMTAWTAAETIPTHRLFRNS